MSAIRDSRKYVTINADKDLSQPNHLRYGIHSATGIFQRKMKKHLGYVPLRAIGMDDILISQKNDKKHFQKMWFVIDKKSIFMAFEVTYLEFRNNKNGAKSMPGKVADLLNAETPKNTKHVKSFLSMLN